MRIPCGGKVTSLALDAPRSKHANLNQQQLSRKLRIGAVLFAAIDGELH